MRTARESRVSAHNSSALGGGNRELESRDLKSSLEGKVLEEEEEEGERRDGGDRKSSFCCFCISPPLSNSPHHNKLTRTVHTVG
jgi:hypothetical protein